jgi:hypothetical protein
MGHSPCCFVPVHKGAFAVINADDFYGDFGKAAVFLIKNVTGILMLLLVMNSQKL